jgi:tetratricopeptide (TPR) repeat protein
MKSRLILLTVLAFATALLAFRLEKLATDNRISSFSTANKRAAFAKASAAKIIRCSPDWESLKDFLEETDIPPIPGAGNYKWKINTASDSAQFYFNQGINMYYSFHIIESMASFKKAARFDPGAAMLQWAQALAYGPNINDLGYSASPDALTVSGKAVELSVRGTAKEKMLIEAMSVRYSPDSTQAREKLNQLYVDKMKAAYQKYPADADIAALYADAMMLQHPWDLWTIDGTPKPWTPSIREVLEKLLVITPNHPGANHYYIHVMEPSPYADKATASADRLGKLTPGLSHTVHMPSHIYLRTGQFGKGIAVNENAISSYKRSIPLYAPVTGNDFLYIIHNAHMQTNQAMLAGKAAYSVQSAIETQNTIAKDYLVLPGALGNYVQYIYMTTVLVDIRFGRWNELLGTTKPGSTQVYGNILYHFGRGMALASLGKPADARTELDQLRQLMKDSVLLIPFSPFSPAIDGAVIAENLLAGTISLKEKKYTDAINAFSKAVMTEENMVYNEPRDWLLNPKQYLGNALLKAGKLKEANEVFQKDLLINKENGWSLYGLYQVLLAEKKQAEIAKMLLRYKKAFESADISLHEPVFN